MNELREQAETLQNLLVSHATGGHEDDGEYRQLRQIFVSNPTLEESLPRFVRTSRSLQQFWEMIKHQHGTYSERRTFIWKEFEPLFNALDRATDHPPDASVSETLERFDATHVHLIWSKALDRRSTDPEGAITAARTLMESVCKSILEDFGDTYEDSWDLPRLYKTTAERLSLAPSQHSEQVFKQILGGCITVVEGLGSLRNKLSDAHGKGRQAVKPAPRHAELAVNLAGAAATFLVATSDARKEMST